MAPSPDRWCWCPTGVGWRSATCWTARPTPDRRPGAARRRGGRLGADADAGPARPGRGDRRATTARRSAPPWPRCCRPGWSRGWIGAGRSLGRGRCPMGWTPCRREDGVVTDTALMRLAPRRGRERVARAPASQRRGPRRAGSFARRKSPRAACACCAPCRTDRPPRRGAPLQQRAAGGAGGRRADAPGAGGGARGRCRAPAGTRPPAGGDRRRRARTGAMSSATRWRIGRRGLAPDP